MPHPTPTARRLPPLSASPSAVPAKHGGGRPPKLTDALVVEVLEYVRKGNYYETAAAAAGLSRKTLVNWLRRGKREGAGPYWEFLLAMRQAAGQAEASDVSKTDPQWRLPRRWPKRWAERARLEVTGKDGKPIQHNVLVIGGTSEEWVKACQEADRLARANGQAGQVIEAEAVEVEADATD